MLRKEDIINKLNTRLFWGKDYWVITGAAMVLYGIKEETKDIDLGAGAQFIDELISLGYSYSFNKDGTRKVSFEEFEIFEDWIYDTKTLVEGIPVITLKGLIKMKRYLGREKDIIEIKKIEKFINDCNRLK